MPTGEKYDFKNEKDSVKTIRASFPFDMLPMLCTSKICTYCFKKF